MSISTSDNGRTSAHRRHPNNRGSELTRGGGATVCSALRGARPTGRKNLEAGARAHSRAAPKAARGAALSYARNSGANVALPSWLRLMPRIVGASNERRQPCWLAHTASKREMIAMCPSPCLGPPSHKQANVPARLTRHEVMRCEEANDGPRCVVLCSLLPC